MQDLLFILCNIQEKILFIASSFNLNTGKTSNTKTPTDRYVVFRCQSYGLAKKWRCHSEILVRSRDLIRLDDLVFTFDLLILVKNGTHWCGYCQYHPMNRYSFKTDKNRFLPEQLYKDDRQMYYHPMLYVGEHHRLSNSKVANKE